MTEDENEYTDSFTGDFINEEPVVFKGITDSELKMVFLISFFCGAPIGAGLAVLIGVPMLIIVFVILFPVIVVWFVAGWMEKARRGKPPGYVEQTLHIKLAEKKLVTPMFVFDSERWGLGRTMRKRR